MPRLLGLLLVLVSVMLTNTAQAQEKQKKKKRKRSKAQWARVINDGSAVYKGPSFDAPIIDYLPAGKKILASKKIYTGLGGFGAFYKVKLKKKTYGYVADTDLAAKGGKKRRRNKSKDPFQNQPELDVGKDGQEEDPNAPIYFKKYLGLNLFNTAYAEKIDGKTLDSDTTMLGAKLSGPGWLVDAPLDININLSFAPPNFYDRFTSSAPSGFFIHSDLLFSLPFMDWNSGYVYYGIGPMAVYTKFDVKVGSTSIDSQELRVGAALMAGVGQRLGPQWLIKAEAKYYYEVTDYTSFGISVQMER